MDCVLSNKVKINVLGIKITISRQNKLYKLIFKILRHIFSIRFIQKGVYDSYILITILCIKIKYKITQERFWENIAKKNSKFVKKILNDIYKPGKTMFVIGDSHSEIFHKNTYDEKIQIYGNNNPESRIWFNCSENFICYHLDAVTAYNTTNRNAKIPSLLKVEYLMNNGFLPKGATIICSFGEIDCRAHISKQSEKQQRPVEEIIDDVLCNYKKFLLMLKNSGYKVIAYGPIPSQSDTIKKDDKFPRYGTETERNLITQKFNQKLAAICLEEGIEYKTLFDKLINDDMTTKNEYLSINDYVHLGCQSFYLLRKLFVKQDNVQIAKSVIPFDKLPENKNELFVLTYNSGEVTVFLELLKQSRNYDEKVKNGVIIATKKYHVDLIEMICPEFEYIYCPKAEQLVNCDEKEFVCSDKKIYIAFPKFLADDCHPLWTNRKLKVHAFDIIKEYAQMDVDLTKRFELTFDENTRQSVNQKIAKHGLKEPFVFIAPEAMTIEQIPAEFWNKLCKKLIKQGYNIFLNLTKDKNKYKYGKIFNLSIKEANLLASMSCGIISQRSGFSEQLALIPKIPNIILYSNIIKLYDYPQIKSDRLLETYSLKKYANTGDNIYEFDAEANLDELTENILDLIFLSKEKQL